MHNAAQVPRESLNRRRRQTPRESRRANRLPSAVASCSHRGRQNFDDIDKEKNPECWIYRRWRVDDPSGKDLPWMRSRSDRGGTGGGPVHSATGCRGGAPPETGHFPAATPPDSVPPRTGGFEAQGQTAPKRSTGRAPR